MTKKVIVILSILNIVVVAIDNVNKKAYVLLEEDSSFSYFGTDLSKNGKL